MKNNNPLNNDHFIHIIIIILLLVIIVMLYMYHSKGNTYESFYNDNQDPKDSMKEKTMRILQGMK